MGSGEEKGKTVSGVGRRKGERGQGGEEREEGGGKDEKVGVGEVGVRWG